MKGREHSAATTPKTMNGATGGPLEDESTTFFRRGTTSWQTQIVRRYFFNKSSTAALMAVTPVVMVGWGSGA